MSSIAGRKIALITDAWSPQVNGVVTTLTRKGAELENCGHPVLVIHPGLFQTYPLPGYAEIRLAVRPGRQIESMLTEFGPACVHIATEGPLGLATRRYCMARSLRFTTAYHTQFPEYVRKRMPIPLSMSYRALRWFHDGAAQTMVATRSMRDKLASRGFRNLVTWERGVDTDLFRPGAAKVAAVGAPLFVYVGRVAVEKNLDAFLQIELPGRKQIIGAGPELEAFKRRYPDVEFSGYRFGEELASMLARADVFIFPSLTDTFGLVMLEAMACGVPVAAFPVTGPIDVVTSGVNGVLDSDLRAAALAALNIDRRNCRDEALTRTWRRASEQFAANLVLA